MRHLPLPLRTRRLRVPTLKPVGIAFALIALVTATTMPSPVAAFPNPFDALRHLYPGQFGFPAVRGMPNSGGPSGPAGSIRLYVAWQGTYDPIGHNPQSYSNSPVSGKLYGSVDYNIVPSKRYVVTEGDMQWDSTAVSSIQADFSCFYSGCGAWDETDMVFHTFQPTANNPAGINIDTGITASDLPGAQVTYPADNESRFYIADPNNMSSNTIYFSYQAFVDTNYTNGSNKTNGQLTLSTYRTNVFSTSYGQEASKDNNAKLCITNDSPSANLRNPPVPQNPPAGVADMVVYPNASTGCG